MVVINNYFGMDARIEGLLTNTLSIGALKPKGAGMAAKSKTGQKDEASKGVSQGIAIGLALGVAFGAAFGNPGIGVALGLCFGMAFGAAYDSRQRPQEAENADK